LLVNPLAGDDKNDHGDRGRSCEPLPRNARYRTCPGTTPALLCSPLPLLAGTDVKV